MPLTLPRYSVAVRSALLILVALGLLLPAVARDAGASAQQPAVQRRAGADRYATAAAVSAAAFPSGADLVYIATGQDFPDALASGPVAAVNNAPVLLVERDRIPAATQSELQRLNPSRIVVLGGTSVVSLAVQVQLQLLVTGAVERLSGADRYATAAAVSRSRFSPGVAVAYIAFGGDFPDALAGGAAAAAAGGPVLLVRPDGLPDATAAELRRLRPRNIVVLGGSRVVGDAVVGQLQGLTAGEVTRRSGPNRFATAVAISRATVAPGASAVYLAAANGFADALAGAPRAGATQSPVLLVQRDCVPADVLAEINRIAPGVVIVLGGVGVVGAGVEGLRVCGAATPGPTPGPTSPTPTAAPTSPADTMRVSVIATGLVAPWDVAFAPEGAYISERDSGRLLLRRPDGAVSEVQRLSVDNAGEGGFLGLALSPDYATDGLLYAFTTTGSDNRVLRFQPGQPPQPILTGLPRASIHDAGRIRFGPDDKLYVGTGDAGVAGRSQDPSSLAGKILRLNPDGTVPNDNPTPGSAVYASGLRDPQGLAWDAAGRLYASEFGPDRDDEINQIVAGGNYGWPVVTGAAGDSRFIDPVLVRQPPEASWSGIAILTGGAIPAWEGDLFVAALRGRRLWRVDLGSGGQVNGAEALLVGDYGRLRAAVQAPDGSLWVLTSNRDGRGSPGADDDRILRIGP